MTPQTEATHTTGVTVERECGAAPDAVLDVLRDGWLFAVWVVGASQIRDVDPNWPEPGSRIHHSVGAWPLLIKDHTESLEYVPGRLLVLRARAWPMGEAQIRIEVHPTASGSRIVMTEGVKQGPGKLLDPLSRLLFPPRNRESLGRLAAIAERR